MTSTPLIHESSISNNRHYQYCDNIFTPSSDNRDRPLGPDGSYNCAGDLLPLSPLYRTQALRKQHQRWSFAGTEHQDSQYFYNNYNYILRPEELYQQLVPIMYTDYTQYPAGYYQYHNPTPMSPVSYHPWIPGDTTATTQHFVSSIPSAGTNYKLCHSYIVMF